MRSAPTKGQAVTVRLWNGRKREGIVLSIDEKYKTAHIRLKPPDGQSGSGPTGNWSWAEIEVKE